MQIFIVTGALLLSFSLLLAWLLSMLKGMPNTPLLRFIRSEKALLQAHIDYILMAILLFIFALSGRDFPPVVAYATIVGSITNPLLFLVMAVKPDVAENTSEPVWYMQCTELHCDNDWHGGLRLNVGRPHIGYSSHELRDFPAASRHIFSRHTTSMIFTARL